MRDTVPDWGQLAWDYLEIFILASFVGNFIAGRL